MIHLAYKLDSWGCANGLAYLIEYTYIYRPTHASLYHTYTDFTAEGEQKYIPHIAASSAHLSHPALQSPVPVLAHWLCCWWAAQSQGLHQLCCPSSACTGQPSGVKGQCRGQCSSKVQGAAEVSKHTHVLQFTIALCSHESYMFMYADFIADLIHSHNWAYISSTFFDWM